MKKFLLPFGVVAVALIVLAVFQKNNSGNPSTGPMTASFSPTPMLTPLLAVTPTASPSANASSSVSASPEANVKSFTVSARQFSFNPATIRVKKGDTVRLTVQSVDVAHGLAIPAFGVNIQSEVGKDASGEFVADKTGTFPFFCSIFCGAGHRDMSGQLIVE